MATDSSVLSAVMQRWPRPATGPATGPAPGRSGHPVVVLTAGETLDPQMLGPACGWRVAQGGLRVDGRHADQPGPARSLLLAGDCLPMADLPGWAAGHRLRALVATRLQADQTTPAEPAESSMARLRLLLAQQWQRSQDMLALRRGSVPDRIKHLMLMLAQAPWPDGESGVAQGAEQSLQLPRVRDIADLVDSAPETVSRTMTALKRLDLLAERKGSATRFDAGRLSSSTLPLGLTRSAPLVRRRRPAAPSVA